MVLASKRAPQLHRYPIHRVLPCHKPRCIKEYIECACSGVMACSTCHVYLVGRAQWLFVCEKEVGGRKQIYVYVCINIYTYRYVYIYIHMFLLIGRYALDGIQIHFVLSRWVHGEHI